MVKQAERHKKSRSEDVDGIPVDKVEGVRGVHEGDGERVERERIREDGEEAVGVEEARELEGGGEPVDRDKGVFADGFERDVFQFRPVQIQLSEMIDVIIPYKY